MSTVTISVNNKSYQIACDEAQQERVKALGDYINNAAEGVAGAAGTEVYQLVLASLVIADELFDVKEQLATLESQANNEAQARAAALEAKLNAQRAQLSATTNGLAEQLENIAQRLKSA